jgi:hypothetical protein
MIAMGEAESGSGKMDSPAMSLVAFRFFRLPLFAFGRAGRGRAQRVIGKPFSIHSRQPPSIETTFV